MAEMTATEAKNKFGQLLELARTEPVRIQKNGRDVGVLLSPEQYELLVAHSAAPRVRPLVEQLLAKSMDRRKALYEALAR
jgi:prevent-host-death family protein